MTNNVQISWKFPDGAIFVIGAEDKDTFLELCDSLGVRDKVRSYVQELKQGQPAQPPTPAPPASQPAQSAPQTSSDSCVLAQGARMEIISKGGQRVGEISPFPGTKYPVKVWPEVLEAGGFTDAEAHEYDVSGLSVGYVKNEKGYPQKVTWFGKG